MGGIGDFGGLSRQTGPSDYGAPVGQPPYQGMIWEPRMRKWVWPKDAERANAATSSTDDTSRLDQEMKRAALEALRARTVRGR